MPCWGIVLLMASLLAGFAAGVIFRPITRLRGR
jgi:hypothetical protein